jgi:hypothetical protein
VAGAHRTADYHDYHQLLNIDRMLTDLTPLIDLITDADLAYQLRTRLHVQAELDPLPTIAGPHSSKPPPTQEQAD